MTIRSCALLLLLLLVLATPAAAQTVVINDTNNQANAGRITHGGNELLNDSKVDDPPAVRMGAPGPGEALGKFSFDRITAAGAGTAPGRKEKVLIIGKVGPNGDGFIEFFGQMPGTEDDAGMVRLLTLHPTDGVIFYGPQRTRPLGSEYDPPVDGGGVELPLLDTDLRSAATAYHVFVAQHTELVEEVKAWHRAAKGREAGTGDVAHALWRVMREADRFHTLRNALQDTWPR